MNSFAKKFDVRLLPLCRLQGRKPLRSWAEELLLG